MLILNEYEMDIFTLQELKQFIIGKFDANELVENWFIKRYSHE